MQLRLLSNRENVFYEKNELSVGLDEPERHQPTNQTNKIKLI